jgi:hypothetical protein
MKSKKEVLETLRQKVNVKEDKKKQKFDARAENRPFF